MIPYWLNLLNKKPLQVIIDYIMASWKLQIFTQDIAVITLENSIDLDSDFWRIRKECRLGWKLVANLNVE